MEAPAREKLLSPSRLKALLDREPVPVLLDVLPPDRYREVHLPGAVNVCVFYASFVEDLVEELPRSNAWIVIYGSSDRSWDAAAALEKMERAGYSRVQVLDGGLQAWARSGYPLAGEDPERAAVTDEWSIAPGIYRLDPSASTLHWTGRNATTSHYGTLELVEGALEVNGEEFSGSLEADLNSISSLNLAGDPLQDVLEAHLKSDDFLFTELFPRALLYLRTLEPVQPRWPSLPNFQVRADLVLRGETVELQFEATLAVPEPGVLLLEAHFDIDRTRWGMIYGSARFFEYLGMHQVFDLISLQLRLKMVGKGRV